MDHFHYIDGELYAENVPMRVIADAVGTPVYVYSRATFERHARVFREALAPLDLGHGAPRLAFAIKANPNLAVLSILQRQGYGADVVSGGEMERALAAGIAPADIVFSGVGKTTSEITAALHAGIGQFNIESIEEGREISAIASRLGIEAQCALRINPDVDARTHEKISTGKSENKFGVPISEGAAIYAELAGSPMVNMVGVATHIGSQLGALEPLETAFGKIGDLVAEIRAGGGAVSRVDLGGGLGVRYRPDDHVPSPEEYGAMVARATAGWDVRLIFEPGRVIAGNAGVLLTQVIRVKQNGNGLPFVIVDAAMNDLARPALYGAWHDFVAVKPSGQKMHANIVGPICETGDTFATNREIDSVGAGDLAIFRTTGAYGATMASSYNSRGFIAEVMVDGDRFAVVAERIAPAAFSDKEQLPEWL